MTMFSDASAAAQYLRDEADFNRSWTDGRRGESRDLTTAEGRLQLAAERDRWAQAIEDLARMAKAAVQPQAKT